MKRRSNSILAFCKLDQRIVVSWLNVPKPTSIFASTISLCQTPNSLSNNTQKRLRVTFKLLLHYYYRHLNRYLLNVISFRHRNRFYCKAWQLLNNNTKKTRFLICLIRYTFFSSNRQLLNCSSNGQLRHKLIFLLLRSALVHLSNDWSGLFAISKYNSLYLETRVYYVDSSICDHVSRWCSINTCSKKIKWGKC